MAQLQEHPVRFPGTHRPFVCRPLIKNAISSTSNSISKTAGKVIGLWKQDDPRRLRQLYRSDYFWDRLVAYADKTKGGALGYSHTYNRPEENALPSPSTDQYLDAMHGLDGLLNFLQTRKPVPLTGADSVGDETGIQIIEVLNATIKTRYANQTGQLDTGEVDEAVDNNVEHFETVSDQTAVENPSDLAHYPVWLRSARSHHQSIRQKDNAGFPSFLLSRTARRAGQAAVCQVKSPWSYKSEDLLSTFFLDPHDSQIVTGDSNFNWAGGKVSAMHCLVRQVFGELIFMGTRLAFVTNGDLCVVWMLVNRNGGNHLVTSLPKKWTDPMLLFALTGLTFAGIDEKSWGDARLADEVFCPANECQVLTTPLPEESETRLLCAQYGL